MNVHLYKFGSSNRLSSLFKQNRKENMYFHLRVYDNFHYGDEDEAYDHGFYSSYDNAVIAAQEIVDEFLEANYKQGMTPEDLMTAFLLYGEDPIILPNEHGEIKRFSARDYAREKVNIICNPKLRTTTDQEKEDAITLAKKEICGFYLRNWKDDMSEDELFFLYTQSFGTTTKIIPNEQGGEDFSTLDYAREMAFNFTAKDKPGDKPDVDIQTAYQMAIAFAASKHQEKNQTVKGTNLPYVVHLSNVTMELFIASILTPRLDMKFAFQVALLHDTLEDTDTSFNEIEEHFDTEIANAVLALTKNTELPKNQQILDSLTRIKKLRKEVWAVKLADRITNLQPPPADWTVEKKRQYRQESQLILDELGEGNQHLADRLNEKISEYNNYIISIG